MKAALAAGLVTFVAACGADAPGARLELPAAPACDVTLVPRTIYDGRDCGRSLLVDDARVTWYEEGLAGEAVYSAPKCGGEPTLLSPHRFVSLARDATGLYALDDIFWSIPDDGSGPVALATGFVDTRQLVLEPGRDTALVTAAGFCSSFAGPTCQVQRSLLWRINRAGGIPVPLLPAELTGTIDSLVLGPDGIYFAGMVGEKTGLFHLADDGSDLRHFDGSEALQELRQLVVDPATGELFGRDISGVVALHDGVPTTVLAAGGGYVETFTIDAHFVYAVFDDGHLGRAPREGGDETVLLRGSHVSAVGLDDAAVYAFDCADPGGRIVTFAR